MFYMHGIGWGWWLVMSIGMVAFWGLVLYGLVLLVRGSSRGAQRPPATRPDKILEQRLAAGEISIAEFNEIRAALGREPRDPVAA